MSRVITSFDSLFRKTYNSLGLSRRQDDVEVSSTRMENVEG